MKITEIAPKAHIPVPKLPKCCCTRYTVYANDTPVTNKDCTRNASILVDGEPFCRQHAGMLLIDRELNK